MNLPTQLLRLTLRELLERVPLAARGTGGSSCNGSSSSSGGSDSESETPNGQVGGAEGEEHEGEGEEEKLRLGSCNGSVQGDPGGSLSGSQEDCSGVAAAAADAARGTGGRGAGAADPATCVSRAVCEQLADCAARLHGGVLLTAALDAPDPVLLLCGACGGRWGRKDGPESERDEAVRQQNCGGGRSGGAAVGSGGARGLGLGQAAGTEDSVGEEVATRAGGGAGSCALLPWCTCNTGLPRVGSGSNGSGGAASETEEAVGVGVSRVVAGGAPPPPPRSASPAAPLVHAVFREVVEVKSTCPFGLKQVRCRSPSPPQQSAGPRPCRRPDRCALYPDHRAIRQCHFANLQSPTHKHAGPCVSMQGPASRH